MTADAWLAAGAALACIGAVVALIAVALPDRNPFGDTVPDMPPPRGSDSLDAEG